MRVSNVMTRHVDYASQDTNVRDIFRLIFVKGSKGIPVCKGKKVIGFITESDILNRLYPLMQEYIEDPINSRDIKKTIKKIAEVFALTADKIMSKNLKVVTADTPLIKVQSLMLVERVGRLPVVDKKGNLIGIISKSDIFRNVVGQSAPLQEQEEFYDWLAKRYDTLINWKKRLSYEIPDLVALFTKEKAKKILDVASSTGEHSIALVKKGFEVFGIESSSLMDNIARSKKHKLPKNNQDKLHLIKVSYKDTLKEINGSFDAAIFLGNTLPHLFYTNKDSLKNIVNVLRKEKALMVFQNINFQKTLDVSQGIRDFTIRPTEPNSYYKANAFLGFYTKEKKDLVTYTRAIFSLTNNGVWSLTAINSTPIIDLRREEMKKELKKLGFKNITFYGSSFNGPLFQEKFNPTESDWLNVVAKR